MNKAYKTRWNAMTATCVAVPETARRAGKTCRGQGSISGTRTVSPTNTGHPAFRHRVRLSLFGIVLCAASASCSQAATISPATLPAGGQVTAGNARIAAPVQSADGAATLNIDQSSPRATINWGSFNLGSNATVNFNQPGTGAATLNRVQGSEPNQIFGKINAPGQVFLLNANGILFGATAQISVGGLTATSYQLSDADFMAVLGGSRTYDGSTVMAGSQLTATGVVGETFSVSSAGADGNLGSRNVQTNQPLASVSGLSLGSSTNGGLAGNYYGPKHFAF